MQLNQTAEREAESAADQAPFSLGGLTEHARVIFDGSCATAAQAATVERELDRP
jgi:hypothetical protein